MNKKVLLLILVMFVISGCSTGSTSSISGWFNFGSSSGKQGTVDTPTSGNGLEISLRIDDSLLPRLRYDLTLKNTGDKMIEISREDLIFTTEQRIQGESVFTRDSLENFYDKLFRNGGDVLQIPPSREDLLFSGVLYVNPDFYKDYTNEDFTYLLKISYEYTTEFDNNVELNLERYEIKTDRPSQAAPVKMRKIEILPTDDEARAQIIYTIEDSAGSFEETIVEIRDIEVLFGSQRPNCRYFYNEQSEFIETQEPILSSIYNSLLLVCDISVYDFDASLVTTTKTSGSFSYIYTLREDGIIKFDSDSRSLGIQ